MIHHGLFAYALDHVDAGAGAGSDDLDDISAALAADQAAAAAPDDGSGDGGGGGLAIDTPDHGPTWREFWDSWELFSDAVWSAVIAGGALGFLSVYVALRRMVFVSAIVTQAAGLGVALSFYAAIHLGVAVSPLVGAIVLALGTAALVSLDPRRFGMSHEMLIGLLFAVTAAGAVLIGSRITQEAHDINAIMFGTAVVVSADDMHHLAWTGAIVMGLHLWWHRGFGMASFDPTAARVQGLPVRLLDLVLLLSIGVMVGEAARALGALPAFAMSTLPGIAALLLARGPLPVTFALSAVFGAFAGAAGYLVAFFHNFPVGSAQAMTAAALVVVCLALRILIELARSLRNRRRTG